MQRNVNLIDRQELSNEYLIAKIGFDTAESEPGKVWITDFADHTIRAHTERLVRPAELAV